MLNYSYIFSASTYNTLIDPSTAFTIMDAAKVKAGLASSYDLYRYLECDRDIYYDYVSSIDTFSKHGEVYIDSGCYEASRYHDALWGLDNFIEAISGLNKQYYYFTYDQYEWFLSTELAIQKVSMSIESMLNMNISINKIIPVLHVCEEKRVQAQKNLLQIVERLILEYGIQRIAIPERDFGDGIFSKVRFVKRFKELIVSKKSNIKLHLLGTGNPLSILLFNKAGADSFDGLEWCRQSADWSDLLLYHPEHLDFFIKKKYTDCDVEFLISDQGLPFKVKIAAHNACAFKEWDKKINSPNFDYNRFVKSNYSSNLYSKIVKLAI